MFLEVTLINIYYNSCVFQLRKSKDSCLKFLAKLYLYAKHENRTHSRLEHLSYEAQDHLRNESGIFIQCNFCKG